MTKFLFPNLDSSREIYEGESNALVLRQENTTSAYDEGYRSGYLACKAEQDKNANFQILKLAEMLGKSLNAPSFFEDYLGKIMSYNLQILQRLANLICTELPLNLHLVLEQLFDSLRKIYKEGRIRIEVNADHYSIFVDLIAKLPNEALKNAIDVVESSQIGQNIYKAYYFSTVFCYNRNQMAQEIEQVIKSSATYLSQKIL